MSEALEKELALAYGRIADLESQLSAALSVKGLQVGWAAIRNGKVNNLSQNKPAHPGKDGWEYWAGMGFTEPMRLLLGASNLSKATIAGLLERARQIGTEGWTPAHDDQYTDGQLARAAACYAMSAASVGNLYIRNHWPWDWKWFKPTEPYRDLEKAFALILADMERRDRIASERAG